jgi:hypothetical protein
MSPMGRASKADPLNKSNLDSKRAYLISPETIKALQMSFSSIEEIERMKRDANMYK